MAKGTLGATPLGRFVFYRFAYNMTAAQLVLLCEQLSLVRAVPGAVLEVGCSTGMTTVFLNKFMEAEGIEKPYFALDTFSGFVEEDVRYEAEQRGKPARAYDIFRTNSRRWFDRTMRMNRVSRVRSIEADANAFDFAPLGPLAFCLLDVDLYRPTRKAVAQLYAQLSPGGVLLVDDCDASHVLFDGADQAYKEFCTAAGLPERITRGIGLLQKPAA